MENLERNKSKCRNTPGYLKIWAASVDEVDSVDTITQNQRSVSFAAGKAFGEIYAKNILLSDVYADGAYQLEINCDFFGIPDVVESRLWYMSFHRFIVKLQDRNGQLWLAGSKDEPLRFEFTRTEDADVTGAKKYEFRFFRTGTEPLFATV